ncbi:MAG: hypothetical protein QHH26_05585 [Armatimonadota bacterium]|nr:hypothetical protein [Armatimonadota bacterium]
MKNEITPEVLQQKLARALKAKAVLTERTKQLQQQIDDFRRREEVMNHIAYELLERQREVNYMLHRASSVLHQLQDTNLAIEGELKQLKGELPEPEDPKWEETVAKVNELFEKSRKLATEVQNEITRGISKEEPLESAKFTEASASNKTNINAQEQPEAKDPQAQNEAETISSEDACKASKTLEEIGEQSETTDLEQPPEKSANEDDPIEQFFRSIQCDETGRIAGKIETTESKRGLMSRLRQFFHIGP